MTELDETATQDDAAGDTLAADDTAADPRAPVHRGGPEFGRGTTIGRYLALGKLGAGAMGVVYAAYDPELDRKLALKLLARGHEQATARTRLQREAQGLAKLAHPNVVGVHDVGVHDEQLFIAMEFVDGQTLGTWMKAQQRPRPWPEVVRVLSEAGRGLAAAHGVGLIHRDFKPENVMIGSDGRVRVMDFGLVRSAGERDDEPSSAPRSTLDTTLTATGALLGTPAYMAAELFAGKPADALADQFAFCVTLHEALYGERPFPSSRIAELIDAVTHERLCPPPRGSNVPAWLRKVVVRGLHADPRARWPSMDALLAALADDPALRRRKRWTAAGLLALLGAAIVGARTWLQPGANMCVGLDDKLAGVWDDARRVELEAAMLGTGLGYAGDTWTRVERHFDDYADAWVTARVEACEATQHGEQSGELLDLRMACLDEQLAQLRTRVDELARIDAATLPRAVEVALGLPALERCADTHALTAAIPPPDDPLTAGRVEALDEQLTSSEAKEDLGRYAEALALAEAVVAEAATLGYVPLQARAWLQLGSLQMRTGAYAEAEATLTRAYDAALGLGMLDVAGSAASMQVYMLGAALERVPDSRRWLLDADPLTRAAGDDELRAAHWISVGSLALVEQQPRAAREAFAQALALRERELPPDHPALALLLNNLGVAAESLEDFEQARRDHERALSIRERALGPMHPAVATSLYNLAGPAQHEGKLDETRAMLERAVEIREASLGPNHPDLAAALSNLGEVARLQGDLAASRSYFERALIVREQALGPDHPLMVYVLAGLGQTLLALALPDDALPGLERAVALAETHGLDPEMLASTRASLGEALWAAAPERGRDRVRARELVEHAHASMVELGQREQADTFAAWLAEHPAE